MKLDLSALKKLPASQREQAEKLLAELGQIHEQNPLLLYNAPDHPRKHPKQLEFHASRAKKRLFAGGNRAGKSAAGVVDCLIQACDPQALPEHLRAFKRFDGPTRGRIVAPKFNENIEQVIFPTLRQWVPRAQLLGGSWDKAFAKSRRVLTFENGSTIQFLTFDQDLDAHAGAALHYVLFDEEPPGDAGLDLFNENLARLVDYDGAFSMTMTPLFGLSWSYDKLWMLRHEPDVDAFQVASDENPHINHKALDEFHAGLTREERQARRQGMFIHFAGLFYEEFSDNTHVVSPPDRKRVQEQTVVVGIDPGLNRPGVTWIAFDTENVGLVFAEFSAPDLIVPQVAERIKAINKAWEVEPAYYVIDPSARNRATVNAEQVQTAFHREGIPAIPGQNDRAAGIMDVKRRLQQKGLYISRECKVLIEEFGRYRKDQNSKNEFDAVKEFDDCFVAGTMVVTERGEIPVEDVKLGDRVWTRRGYASVIGTGKTKGAKAAPTRILELADGRAIRGTEDHPIWVEGRGFVPMDAVDYGDILLVWQEAKSSLTTAPDSGAIPTPHIGTTGSISTPPGAASSIGPFGPTITAQSPKATTSTTRTETPSTTTPTISSASRLGRTFTSTGAMSVRRGLGRICTRFARWPANGIARMKAVNGTAGMAVRLGLSGSRRLAVATNAGASLSPSVSVTMTAFAPTLVSPRGAEQAEWTTRTAPAPPAVSPGGSTSTPEPRLVRVSALGSYAAKPAEVFNLTVYGAPEYLANGVLVHNCLDSMRYALMSRPWRAVTTPEPTVRRWTPGVAPPLETHTPVTPAGFPGL